MTRYATIGLDDVQPLSLALDTLVNAVSLLSGSGKLALVRNPEHRVPVNRRIILRRRAFAWRNYSLKVKRFAGSGFDLRRIDQPVTANPDAVIGFREVGYQIAALIVGDNDLDEFGGKVGCLSDDPDAGFGSLGAGDHAADVIVVDAHGGALLATQFAQP